MNLTVELQLLSGNQSAPVVHRLVSKPVGWKFTAKQPDGELLYRTSLSGGLILEGADYAWLYAQWQAQTCCAEIWVNVYKPACTGGNDEPFWAGYFTLDAARWNFTDCKAEVREIKPRDAYDALYRVWGNPVNVLATTQTGGGLGRLRIVALYADSRTWQPDAQGILQHVLPDGNAPGTGYLNLEHEYNDGLPLLSFLTKLAIDTTSGTSAATVGIRVESEFYSASINPVTKRTNNQRAFMAGSDAKRPFSVDNADVLTVSLKEILDDLKTLHNVYHIIDPVSGLLRLEHYSWFAEQRYAGTGRVSFNLLCYPEALAKANNESIDLENLYGYEELVINNNNGTRFPIMKTGSVKYEGVCQSRDEKGQPIVNTMTVNRIFTDLDAAYRNPESVPEDAIFLCEVIAPGSDPNVKSGAYQLASAYAGTFFDPSAPPLYDPTLPPNSTQSAAVLFADYHRYGRSFVLGRVNSIKQKDGSYSEGSLQYMISRRPTRRQEGIVIPVCCEDLPLKLNGYLKTNRFDRARLDKAVFDPDADTLTVDVVADSRCQGVPTTPPDPGTNCPVIGTVLRVYIAENYILGDGTVLAKAQVTEFADGNCGSYSIAFPYIPPIELPPVTIPG